VDGEEQPTWITDFPADQMTGTRKDKRIPDFPADQRTGTRKDKRTASNYNCSSTIVV